jgi:hypothetical protein
MNATVDAEFKVEPGDGPYPEDRYAWLDGEWVRVPQDRIVAPDGRAYVFVMYGRRDSVLRASAARLVSARAIAVP